MSIPLRSPKGRLSPLNKYPKKRMDMMREQRGDHNLLKKMALLWLQRDAMAEKENRFMSSAMSGFLKAYQKGYVASTVYTMACALGNLHLEYFKENDMPRMEEKIMGKPHEHINEIADYILAYREQHQAYWWLGLIGDNDTPDSRVVCIAMRGYINKRGFWVPVEDEICGEACAKLLTERVAGSDAPETRADALVMVEHCTSREHIINMLSNLPPERQEAEYQFMLRQTMKLLADAFADD